MTVKLKVQKQALFCFLFDNFPEISDKYCKADKDERKRMLEQNKKALNKICGNRR